MSARLSVVTSLVLALSLAACDNPDAGFEPPADAPFYNSALTGDYELVNGEGQPVRSSDFAGEYQLIYFGYTYCPNVCPFDVQRMMRGYDLFAEEHPERAAKLQPIFVTVDPERDTPEVVTEFANAFSPELLGLTGSMEQIETVAENFFFTFAKIDPIAEGAEYDVQHPSIGYLVDPEGNPMAPIPVMESPEAVATELEKWVR